MADRPQRILFVCLGNICRSPAAEGILRTLIAQRGLQACLEVDSAGTSSYHIGEPPDRRMVAAAAHRGWQLTSRARMVHPRDFRDFDLLLAMDEKNLNALLSYPEATADRVQLLSQYLPPPWPREVPDPYFGGDAGFAFVLDMLEAACPQIIAAVCASEDAPE